MVGPSNISFIKFYYKNFIFICVQDADNNEKCFEKVYKRKVVIEIAIMHNMCPLAFYFIS